MRRWRLPTIMSYSHTRTLLIGALVGLCAARESPSPGPAEMSDTTSVPGARVSPDTTVGARGVDTSATDTSSRTTPSTVDSVEYQADVIVYEIKARKLYLSGNAVVRYRNMVLEADSITYTMDENLFHASGSPQLVEGGDTTVGETMVYNIKTRRGSVTYAASHMDRMYFTGRRVVKNPEDEFYAQDGNYTSCARFEDPHYSFYARDIKVIPNDKAVARPAVFDIADVPVAALPYFIFPIERKRTSGLLTPSFGGNPGRGGYLDNVGYYYAPNDYVDMVGAFRVEEFNEFLLRASSRYNLRYRLNGSLGARYNLGGDFRGRTSSWALDYGHNQNITPDRSVTLSGRGSLVGNKDFYRENSERTDEILQQSTQADMSLHKKFSSINASSSVSWSRDHNLSTNTINENIPSVSFSLPSRPIIPERDRQAGGGEAEEPEEPEWYRRIYYSYSARGIRKHRSDPEQRPAFDREYYRSGVEQSADLRYNHTILKWFNISPRLSVRTFALDAYKDTVPDDTLRWNDTTFDTLSAVRVRLSAEPLPVLDTLVDDTLGVVETSFVVVDEIREDSLVIFEPTTEWFGDYTWNGGVSLNTTLYGLFPIRFLSLAGVRHILTPSVSYNYTPKTNQPNKTFYPVGISPGGGRRRSQAVSFSVSNDFHAKTVSSSDGEGEPEERTFHFLGADLSTGYDFEAEERKWRDLSLTARTSNRLLNVNFGSAFWLYDGGGNLSAPILREYSVRLSPQVNLRATGLLWGGDRVVLEGPVPDDPVKYLNAGMQEWSLGIGPNYTFRSSRATPSAPFSTEKVYQLNANARIGFSRKWSVSWGGGYDFERNRMTSGDLNFYNDLECWEMRFRWGPPGSVNPGYRFLIRIKKIPEVKWEKRD